jgi:hypothetical protein
MGENRTHNTVSTVSRVSDHEDRAALNHLRPDLDRGFNYADDADGAEDQ